MVLDLLIFASFGIEGKALANMVDRGQTVPKWQHYSIKPSIIGITTSVLGVSKILGFLW